MSKITHEQARERLQDVLDYNDKYDKVDNDVLLSDYINQQEKQEQLLELYKQCNNILQHLRMPKSLVRTSTEALRNIENQIRELENEL